MRVRPSDYQPLAPAVCDDPYPFYAVLRQEAPVHRVAEAGFYAVSRYADVTRVLRDPARFSSEAMRAAVTRPSVQSEDTREAQSDSGAVSLIGLGGSEHTRVRNLVNRGFTPGRVAALEPRIRQLAVELLGNLLDSRAGGACDLAGAFAGPLPVMVIAELVGVDPGRRAAFQRWANDMMVLVFDQPDADRQREIADSSAEMGEYMDTLIEERRRRPDPERRDLLSALLEAEAAGGALSLDEARVFVFTLLVAGSVTTAHLIGNATVALLRHPGELGKLISDPALIPGMIEEALRFDGPVHLLLRTAMEDVELAGTTIPEGAVVAALNASANRDEQIFAEPDRFDVTRRPKDHLAFGHGVHFCLGAALARLEARIAFEVLLPLLANAKLAAPPRWLRAPTLRGPERLELEIGSTR